MQLDVTFVLPFLCLSLGIQMSHCGKSAQHDTVQLFHMLSSETEAASLQLQIIDTHNVTCDDMCAMSILGVFNLRVQQTMMNHLTLHQCWIWGHVGQASHFKEFTGLVHGPFIAARPLWKWMNALGIDAVFHTSWWTSTFNTIYMIQQLPFYHPLFV